MLCPCLCFYLFHVLHLHVFMHMNFFPWIVSWYEPKYGLYVCFCCVGKHTSWNTWKVCRGWLLEILFNYLTAIFSWITWLGKKRAWEWSNWQHSELLPNKVSNKESLGNFFLDFFSSITPSQLGQFLKPQCWLCLVMFWTEILLTTKWKTDRWAILLVDVKKLSITH